ncbi:glycosyltransferase family 4 protein [Cupriavidus metallidurans]|uniref:glycosyltransferase family 4 protein n=1 Tax=Cupriavidus metallidurans TaxID=119219 RepID=UPI003D732A6D
MLHYQLSSAFVQNQPSPRPRVAYVITNTEIGGAQSHVADLLRALRGRIDATVLAGGDGPLFASAQAAGAATVRLSLLDNAMSIFKAIATLRQLKAALRRVAPDLIHVHSAKAGALGRIAASMLGVPVVYTVHGFAFKPAAPRLRRMASRVAEWCLAPLTTRLICVADTERALAASLPMPAARISVIHNGIPDDGAHAEPGGPLRRIVMVARFAAPKRPDIVIRAFARANLDNCELVIAGDGPTRAAMRALADELAPGRISLPGNVDDIAGLLASAQIFVLASDHEGLPVSVLEAMRAGLPVVASDLPGIREEFGAAPAGLLVPDNDEAAMAEALIALAGDPIRRAAMGQAARGRWNEAFEVEAMAKATWQVYLHALGRRQTVALPAEGV